MRQARPGEAWVVQAGQSIHLRVLPLVAPSMPVEPAATLPLGDDTVPLPTVEEPAPVGIAAAVLAGNSTPDHVTIARFRVRHEQALAGLLIQSLKLCAAGGLVRLGLVALDGTKIKANAAAAANRTHAHSEQ